MNDCWFYWCLELIVRPVLTVSGVTGGLWRPPVLSFVLLGVPGGPGSLTRLWRRGGHRTCVGVVPAPAPAVLATPHMSLSREVSLSVSAAVITVSTLIMTFSDITDNILLISLSARQAQFRVTDVWRGTLCKRWSKWVGQGVSVYIEK